ncbi:hypothetical protein HDV00_002704 [Rhizophlyctis rosea]|nr:hypothetical protein HDV00_002704 [Rhizophlyctis rosea]
MAYMNSNCNCLKRYELLRIENEEMQRVLGSLERDSRYRGKEVERLTKLLEGASACNVAEGDAESESEDINALRREVVKTSPERLLDAPGMSDDYFLRWSSFLICTLDDPRLNIENGTGESPVRFSLEKGYDFRTGGGDGDGQGSDDVGGTPSSAIALFGGGLGGSSDRHDGDGEKAPGGAGRVVSAIHKVAELAFHETDDSGLK